MLRLNKIIASLLSVIIYRKDDKDKIAAYGEY